MDHKKHHQQLKRIFREHHRKIGENLQKLHTHFHGTPGQPSGFRIKIFETVGDIPAGDWEKSAGDNILLSLSYARAVENAAPRGITPFYALFYQEEKPVMSAYFQLVKINRDLHKKVELKPSHARPRFFDGLHDNLTGRVTFNMLVCGNTLLSGENCVGYLGGLDEERIYRGIGECMKKIKERLKGKTKIDIMLIKDFCRSVGHKTDRLAEFGYQEFSAGPNMVIPIRNGWKTFDDYMANMKSKYRRRVKSTLKKGALLVKKSLSYEELSDEKTGNEIYALYLQVVNQAKFKLFVLERDFFRSLKKQLGHNFELDAYYFEDRMVAFTTRIYSGPVMEGYTHGLNYGVNKKYELYQNILYDDVRQAIRRESSSINLGRTSIAMKSSVGAVPEEMTFFISLLNPVSNSILRAVKYFLKPSPEYCRNPFPD